MIRYSNVLTQIGSGETWSVYIDDTGPAGRSVSPTTLPHDRETHVAAIFPPAAGATLMEQMPGALEELRIMGGEDEFHFVKIYNGSGPYRQLDIATRLALFRFFAEVAVSNDLRFLVQSIDATTSQHVRAAAAAQLPRIPGLLDPASNKDISRIFLFVKVRQYLLDRLAPGQCAPIFIDEGWKSNGKALSVPTWNPPFYRGVVMSANSRDVWGLQFADFAAFVLNRSQVLLGRKPLSSLDVEFLKMATAVAPLFVDITVVPFELESLKGED